MNNIFSKKRLTLNSIDSKSSVKKKQRSEKTRKGENEKRKRKKNERLTN